MQAISYMNRGVTSESRAKELAEMYGALCVGLLLVIAAHRKYRARSLSQQVGRGAGEVCRQAQLAMHGPHAENDQVCRLLARDFQDSIRWRSELVAELEHAFHTTPRLGFRGNQFPEAV